MSEIMVIFIVIIFICVPLDQKSLPSHPIKSLKTQGFRTGVKKKLKKLTGKACMFLISWLVSAPFDTVEQTSSRSVRARSSAG